MSEYKYQSPFKRVYIDESGGFKIKKLQEDFDKFWKQVNRVADKCPEKFHAMKAMQEACMWLTRATALQNQKIEAEPTAHVATQEIESKLAIDKLKGFADLKEGQVIKNCPTIVVKRKKI